LPSRRLILGDDGVRDVEDHLGGAVVLLQPHHAGVREVLLEVAHVAHFGAAPAVDRLIVVAHHEHVAVAPEQAHQLVLGPVGVLELVDQHELEPVPPAAEALGMLPEEPERMEHQVVEVHRVLRAEGAGQRPVHVGRDPISGSCGADAARASADCMRFLAAEMMCWTARGGKSRLEWPRPSSRRLMRASRSSSSKMVNCG
jgi:hypothetical protein